MSEPKVSIVIPTYQRADTIERAIQSAAEQDFDAVELIVVDDGSTDATKDIVERIAASNPRVRYLQQANQGPAAARNTGIKYATGELIAFLDADDEWLPGKLRPQVQLLQERSEIDLIFCDGIQDRGNISAPSSFSTANARIMSRLSFMPLPDFAKAKIITSDDLDRLLYEKDFIHLSSVVIRKSKLREVGYFNPSRFGTEDIDLWVRLASRSTFCYWDEIRTIHHNSGDNLSAIGERWLREQVSYHAMCLDSAEYRHLKALAAKKLKAAYRSLIVYYALCRQPVKALAACRNSLSQVFDLRIPAYTLLSFLGPAVFKVGKRLMEQRA